MENKDNKIVENFFNQYKEEIVDDGFADKVLKSFPEKRNNYWIVPVFGLIGFYITVLLIDIRQMIAGLYLLSTKVEPVYFIAFFCVLPVVLLALWFINQRKYSVFR
ncbi:MAG: DUF5056 domain-containing protein [Paludibacteraceae bacterium]